MGVMVRDTPPSKIQVKEEMVLNEEMSSEEHSEESAMEISNDNPTV